jgi:endonuclease/exonuclease/phosphatase family metal-dependent hydrolase
MKFLTGLVVFLSLLVFSSVFISPEVFPYAGLLPFLIPVALLVNLFLFFVLALAWRRLAFFPLFCLVVGYKFFLITLQLHPKNEAATGLKVLTYNARLFNYKNPPVGTDESSVFSWLNEHPAEIKVIQEFYQDYTIAGKNALKLLSRDGELDYSYHALQGDAKKRSNGMAIFSSYPIVNEGIVFDEQNSNGAIFADVQVGKDTLRVYNVHLASMSIEAEAFENYDSAKQIYKQTIGKLHQGSLQRAKQMNILEEHFSNSPHPVILMGDLNELPYSNAYFRLSKTLQNAFELAGRGFGFTFNRILFFLRIDHIFSSPALTPVQFTTHREVDYSDHYPLSATFTWEGFEP